MALIISEPQTHKLVDMPQAVALLDKMFRDRAAGKPIALPSHYFPKDDPTRQPENRWRSHAHLLFGNWINELYQTTPFDVAKIGNIPEMMGKDAA